MRITRMRAAVAGVLGLTVFMLAAPASAGGLGETPTPTPTPTVTPGNSPTAQTGATPSADPSATPSVGPSAAAHLLDLSATPSPSVDPSATPSPSVDPNATASLDPSATPSATATATGGTGDPVLDGFLEMLPFKVPLDKEIDGIEDFDINPLVLSYTCTDAGPDWKMQNLSDKAFGFGWFDTSLGAGVAEIGPGETLDLESTALAVIASPWDAETGYLLVTVPTVGVSDCAATPVPAAAPVALPAATPAVATAVRAEPYYTG